MSTGKHANRHQKSTQQRVNYKPAPQNRESQQPKSFILNSPLSSPKLTDILYLQSVVGNASVGRIIQAYKQNSGESKEKPQYVVRNSDSQAAISKNPPISQPSQTIIQRAMAVAKDPKDEKDFVILREVGLFLAKNRQVVTLDQLGQVDWGADKELTIVAHGFGGATSHPDLLPEPLSKKILAGNVPHDVTIRMVVCDYGKEPEEESQDPQSNAYQLYTALDKKYTVIAYKGKMVMVDIDQFLTVNPESEKQVEGKQTELEEEYEPQYEVEQLKLKVHEVKKLLGKFISSSDHEDIMKWGQVIPEQLQIKGFYEKFIEYLQDPQNKGLLLEDGEVKFEKEKAE